MRYLQQLLHTKAPSNARLLDIALILSIIPHLFVAKIFMLLYMIIALLFIFKKSSKQLLLMLIGLFLITLSFFSSYNFSDFSRMQFFVSLVSSLLIFAVSLQRVTQEINIYLKISPVLLMVLSFFFYNSLFMLFYSLGTLFIFILLYIWSRMDSSLLHVVKFSAKLFVLSLPVVAILFLVFPRISIEKTDFGFRADKYIESGYDGTMRVSADAIRLSNKIVMEVLFADNNISDSQLYFRGSTLSEQQGLEWIEDSTLESLDTLTEIQNIKEYEATLYPHAKNWIYTLDMPLTIPKKTRLQKDYTLRSDKPLYEKKKYLLKSALHYKLSTEYPSEMLKVDRLKSERTFQALDSIREQKISSKAKAYALVEFFKNQNLSYTLMPTGIDLDDFSDSFLLESKNGYCVHFASAFASSARMLGIPSRVVTGFKGEKKDMINNYLLLKASNAHAWVELYFKEEGWSRFDPTATATKNLMQTETEARSQSINNSYFTKANRYFLYTKYMINRWILDYDRAKQMQILKQLMNNTLYLLKFLFAFIALIALTTLLFFLLKSSQCEEKLECEMQKLLKLFTKFNISKTPYETMQKFLLTTQKELDINLEQINRLYHQMKYTNKGDNKSLELLKLEIQRVKKQLKERKR